jgi:hypothetical protein
MARVLVEQTLEPPLGEDGYARLARKLETCLDIRDAVWTRGYLSPIRCVLEIEAPDAESVRRALRSSGVPHGAAFAVELVEPAAVAAGPACAVLEGAGDGPADPGVPGWSRTYVARDGTRRVIEVTGAGAAALAASLAGAAGRVWIPTSVFRIEDHPDRLARRERLRARALR